MITKKLYSAILLLVTSVLVASALSITSFAAKQNIDVARIELSDPVDIDTFVTLVEGQRFDEVILESSFIFGEREMYDFHIVRKDKWGENIADAYINNREALIADAEGITSLSVQDREEIENIKIRIATFIGTEGDIDRVISVLDIKKIDTVDYTNLKQPRLQQKPESKNANSFFIPITEAASTQTVSMYQYVPTSGKSLINNSSVSGFMKSFLSLEP